MRIQRICLSNFRGVSDCEVSFGDVGVTIIEGENEVGKTSVTEAIDLILSERDDSTKRAVKAIKPVHKDVGAEVEIELTTGPYRLRYRKRWHKHKETVLEILEPTRVHLTGREAHDKVLDIMNETLDGPLFEALRLRQGVELEQAAFAGGSLGRALDLAAGGDATGDREDDLWERITNERDRYFTPTGQERVERTTLRAEVAAAQARVDALTAELGSFDDDAAQVARLRHDAVVLADRLVAQDRIEANLAEKFEAIERRRAELGRLTATRTPQKRWCSSALAAHATREDLGRRAKGRARR